MKARLFTPGLTCCGGWDYPDCSSRGRSSGDPRSHPLSCGAVTKFWIWAVEPACGSIASHRGMAFMGSAWISPDFLSRKPLDAPATETNTHVQK